MVLASQMFLGSSNALEHIQSGDFEEGSMEPQLWACVTTAVVKRKLHSSYSRYGLHALMQSSNGKQSIFLRGSAFPIGSLLEPESDK